MTCTRLCGGTCQGPGAGAPSPLFGKPQRGDGSTTTGHWGARAPLTPPLIVCGCGPRHSCASLKRRCAATQSDLSSLGAESDPAEAGRAGRRRHAPRHRAGWQRRGTGSRPRARALLRRIVGLGRHIDLLRRLLVLLRDDVGHVDDALVVDPAVHLGRPGADDDEDADDECSDPFDDDHARPPCDEPKGSFRATAGTGRGAPLSTITRRERSGR